MGKRDKRICKASGLKSWDGKKVRAFIKDYMFDKQKKLESVSNELCCVNLLFGDPLRQVLVQKKNKSPNYEHPVEAGYYNTAGRTLRLKDVCVQCNTLGVPDFLFGIKELREKCLSGGHRCLPKYLQTLLRERKEDYIKRKEECNTGEEREGGSKWELKRELT